MIESLLSVVGQRGVDALAFLLAFALTALMDSVFHDKLPHDHGREFAVNGALSKGKARGSGLIFVLCIALVSLAFLPFKVEYVIYTILLIASMLSGYFDDAAETAWNEYKKGIIDFAIAIVAGVTYLNFNGCSVNFLQWSFTLPYAVYLLLIVILIWTSINVVNCTDGVDGLSASVAVVTIGTYLLAYKTELGAYATAGVVFIGAAFCMVAIDALLRKQYRTMIPVAAAFLPALIWTAFMKLNGLYAESIAITRPFWDGEKAGTIYRYMKLLYTNTTYYGWTFAAFIPAIVLNIIQAVRKKDNFYLAGMILLAAFAYALVLYQIDYKWDSMHNVLSYSAKRFLFCFVPCVWYYLFSQELVVKAGKWIDNYLCWNEKINFMKKNK